MVAVKGSLRQLQGQATAIAHTHTTEHNNHQVRIQGLELSIVRHVSAAVPCLAALLCTFNDFNDTAGTAQESEHIRCLDLPLLREPDRLGSDDGGALRHLEMCPKP